eukprot:TRINITY_DN9113_c0_g1_i2.p1 TRINITY_DN9113_c0_g1~~TRINITY_DN9113_c0_g1_i2.p1  ORF type:complete len:115 (-),score=0.69 TRINITY_DN9113_c0_g1_i2:294-638(-)
MCSFELLVVVFELLQFLSFQVDIRTKDETRISFGLLEFLKLFTMVRKLSKLSAEICPTRACISLRRRSTIRFRQSLDVSKDTNSGQECSICLHRQMEVIIPCMHQFCSECAEEW